MNGKSGGLRLGRYRLSEEEKPNATELPAEGLYLGALVWLLADWFPDVAQCWWLPAIAAVVAGGLFRFLRWAGRRGALEIGIVVVLSITGGTAAKQILTGTAALGNEVLARLTACTGRIFLSYTVAVPGNAPLAAAFAVAVAAGMLHLSLKMRRCLLWMPVALAVGMAVVFGVFPVAPGVVMLGMGCALLLIERTETRDSQMRISALHWHLIMAVTCAAVAVGVAVACGSTPGKVDVAKQAIHTARYDSQTNSMPEGQLKNLAAWEKCDAAALEVTMTQPQQLYLRGIVYEYYTGTAWEKQPSQTLAQQQGLFYWLHQGGFYGQSQLSTAAMLTTRTEPAILTVKNISACSAHGYYPYGLVGNETLDSRELGDTALPPASEMEYLPGGLEQWHRIQNDLVAAQNRQNVETYLAMQCAYEDYVKTADLQMTNESWSVLERQLGAVSEPQTLAQIREKIRDYLENALVYDETAITYSADGDFLQYVLEKSGSGYSVHYATAAVLMLRYYGVPARYVEGYFLSGEEAAACKPGEAVVLTEENAHAWAEYYLPGVGFVPFEVTPGYIDEEEWALGNHDAQDERTYEGESLQYTRVEQPERIEEPTQKNTAFSMPWKWLLWLLPAGLLGLVAVVLLRRSRLRHWLKAATAAPNREAIVMRYAYADRLLRSCPGMVPGNGEPADKINREALFSDHVMTREQRQTVEHYAAQVLNECRRNWTLLEKIRYRLWDCLY